MAGYSIQGSYETVQVITPTLVQPIVYTTIQTTPSNVVASIPLDKIDFDAGTSGPLLQAFANGIETIMGMAEVIAGIGSQQLDANGLLSDFVTFTVQYVGPNTAKSGVTAEADVPVGLLEGGGDAFDVVLIQEAEAMIVAVYNNLKAAAGG